MQAEIGRDRGKYRIKMFKGADPSDPDNDNCDVEVDFENGERFGATFFTLRNIRELMARYASTGECHGGTYFWCKDMVIVQTLTDEVVEETVAALIREGELDAALADLNGDRGADL
jgi:hypothetical protein